MMTRIPKSLGLIFLCLVQLSVYSQTHTRSIFDYIFTSDSLRGFNEQQTREIMVAEGTNPQDFKGYMYFAKRQFIDEKYHLNNQYQSGFKTSPATPAAAPCVNEGFEMGNLTGWTASRGTNTNSCNYMNTPTSIGLGAPYLQMYTTPFVDPIKGVVPNSPFAGNRVIRLNDNVATGTRDVVKLTQNFNVTSSNFLYQFAYIAVMNSPHTCCQQPYMYVRLRDCIGNLLGCPVFSITPPSTPTTSCPGTGPTTWTTDVSGNSYNQNWQRYSIDLTSYISSCVTIEVIVGECSQGGHWGYAYFDSECTTFGISVNGSVTPAPTSTVNVYAPCATTATLGAPGGLNPYVWNGPAGSGIVNVTTQSITTAVAGNYTISMTPVGICTPIFRIVNLKFVPPLTITATPSQTVCAGNPATLTASGATSYTWSTGAFTSTTVVTPAATTIYTVTAQTSTCSTTGTIQINTTSSPAISVSASSPSVCAGSTVALTASGATTYSWQPGGLTGSVVVVTPTTSTTYTAYGTTGACTGTNSIFINVISPPNVVAFTSTPSICSGGSANLFAGGASTYTWNPGGMTGPVVAVSPTVTTTYTVTGSNGGTCNGTNTVTLIVNTPTVTALATPSIICSGNSSTLTASGASTYTWNPGSLVGSPVTVTPSVTTIYTVVGTNTTGCTNSRTVSITVNTTPTVTASGSPTLICSGNSTTLTAVGATTYTWMPGSLTGSAVSVSPTSNTSYTVTGSNGPCTNTAIVTISVNPSPTITASSSPTAICSGNSATLTATGAVTYTWSPGALTGSVVTVTPGTTTTYSASGTNSVGCTRTGTVLLTVNVTPTVNAAASSTAICSGSSATLTGTGATTYTWMPGSLTGSAVTVSPAANTTYTVTGANGPCSSTRTIAIVVNPNPTVNAVSNPTAICAGSSATLTGSGASAYTWMPGSLTGSAVTVSPASSTTYTLTGANGFGCTNTRTVALVVNANPTVNATASPTAICVVGSVTLSATGATSYTWNPMGTPGSSVVVNPTVTTTYSVTGINAAGCLNTRTISVIVNSNPTITASGSPTAICSGNSATLSASGATTYTWMPGSLTGSAVTVSPGATTMYTVTGSNGAGCTSTRTVNLIVNPTPTVNASSSPTAICSGNSATLTATGATTYTWNPGALTGSAVAVSPASTTVYTVTGTTGSCSNTRTVSLVVNTTPTITATPSPTGICVGNTATLTATGATNYTWNPGALTGSAVAVTPTTTTIYTVTGTTGSCSNTRTVSITVTNAPTVTALASPTAICVGASATLTGSGATSYTWNPGALTGSNVTVSPTVTTTYTVSGSNGGCPGTGTVTLVVNGTPTLTAVSSPTSVCSGSGASSTLTATGASTYTWNPGALTGSTVAVTPTATTIYTVTGTSAAGCVNTRTVSVTMITTPTVVASASPTAICIGSSATLSANGATTYTWMPGSLTGSNVIVSPSVTTVYTVTGVNGACVNTRTVSLTVNANPTVTAMASPTVICSGGSSTLTASGATSYTWNPGALTGTAVTVSPGVTTIYTVTGSNGICSNTATLTLSVTPTPTVNATASPTAICVGSSATLSATGATSYTWNPGALTGSNVSVSPTITTIYTVTGANGSCINTRTISLTVNPNPTVSAVGSPTAICVGASATLTGSGATSYTWNPGALTGTAVTVSPTVNTTYTVTGVNASGCANTTTVSLVVNPNPTVTALSTPTSICSNSGASATLTASGASTYTWNPGALTGTSVAVTPTSTTIYTVTGATVAGCTNSNTVSVTVIITPTVTAMVSPTAICVGSSATLTTSGATTYTWNPGAMTGTSAVVSPTATTIYTVTGANGACTNSQTVSLTVNPNPTVNATASPTAICSGNSSTLTASGAATYTWNPGAMTGTSITVIPSITTTYTVTGATAFGCTNTATLTLSVTPTPTVTANTTPTAICVGSTATLSANGATTYTWNPGALTGSNVAVSPSVTTVYTVTGANGSCLNTQTVSLTVNSNPTVSAVTNPTAICAGESATLTGSGAISYTWNPGALTGTSVVVSPGVNTTYTVSGANVAGCTNTNTVALVVNANPTITAVASPTAICVIGTSTLTATGAVSYTWMPGSITGSSTVVAPITTTNYTVTGINATGCSSTGTVTVMVNSIPTVTASSTPTSICAGSSATLNAGGATTYTWMPGSLSGSVVVVSPTITTTYSITGANGACSDTAQVTVVVNPTPVVSITVSPIAICSGATSTLTGGGAASYTWNPGSLTGTSVVVTPSITTNYTLTGSNAFGCTNSATVTVSVTPTPTLNPVSSPTAICAGASATLSSTGATSYSWMPGAVTGSSTVVSPTATTVYTVTGANGFCTSTNTVMLTVNPNPTITALASPTAICSGGSSTLTANGATSYTWNPGAMSGSTAVVSPTANTTYTITGANGSCTSTTTLALVVNPNPTITASVFKPTLCLGDSTTLSAFGATSYTWVPAGTGVSGNLSFITPTITTTYTVTGMTAAGCSGTATITVVVNTFPTVTAASSPTSICAGASATLTGNGATTYTWNPGAMTGTSVVVSPTVTTTYTINGANGSCTGTGFFTLTVNPNPTVTAVSNPTVICAGSSATLTGNGATSYTWNPGALTGTSVVVSPTINTTYTVIGNNGTCSSSNTVSLVVNASPTVNAVSSSTSICSGASATLTASGATSYTWNPGASTATSIVVSPTATTVYTLTGNTGGVCSGTTTLSLVVLSTPTVTATSSPTLLCAGSSATLTGSGAISYTWMPGSLTGTSVVVSPTVSTIYTVSGSNGTCGSGSFTMALTVSGNPTITASSSPTAICRGSSATLTANGALSYTWNPGALTGTSVVVSPTVNTQYTITGVNAAGCISTRTLNLPVLNTPTVNAIANPTAICSGQTATMVAFGAAGYTWNPGGSTANPVVVTPTATTIYTVTGINGLGCTNTRTVSITVNVSPTLTAAGSPTMLCSGSSSTLTASGATTYTWNPGGLPNPTVVVTPTSSTIFTVTGSNGGCSATRTVGILVINVPTVTASGNPTLICSGASSTLSATGAVTYTWNPGAITGSNTVVSPTATTIYTVTGANGAGCTNVKTVTVTVNTPTISVAASNPSICVSGSSTLTASGANTYTWMPGASTGTVLVVTPTVTSTYTVSGTSSSGCIGTETISIIVNTIPTITAVSSPTNICSGSSATLTGSGATSYTWDPGAMTGTAVVVSPTVNTTYTVTGTNGACSNTETVTVAVTNGPTVSAVSSPTAICAGSTTTLTGSGALSYTWNPGTITGSAVVVSPTVTTTYTFTGDNAAGCTSSDTITVFVNTPTLVATATPTSICIIGSVTLSVNGASTYTWNPGAISGPTTVVNPTVTSTYTVDGTNSYGCTGTTTITVVVNVNPTVAVSASSSTICSGYTTTLNASGATTYTWMPGSLTGGTVAVTPSVSTIYTVTGENGSCAPDTKTISITVIPAPANVTANNTGTLTCLNPTVNLLGSTTSTNVTFLWNGPGSYTSSLQNPGGITSGGIYTLSVIDLSSACVTTATTEIIDLKAGPPASITTTGSLTCLSSTMGVTATSTVATASFTWTGPASFSTTAMSFTASSTGVYTLTGFDPATGCTSVDTLAVIAFTNVPITATIVPSTCTGTISNNNGTIVLANFGPADKFDFVAGPTYTGSATYASAILIPAGGQITNSIANPTVATAYTVRMFGSNGCFKDTTLFIQPIDCSVNNALGIAKAVSSPTLQANGSYDVTYTVVVKNYGAATLNNVTLTENLANTFPAPATWSIISAPLITSMNSSLSIDPAFNGSTSVVMTNTTSQIDPGKSDTIVFTLNVVTNGIFGTFNNSVLGSAIGGTLNTVVNDSSEVGTVPDPDNDGNPTNNNVPTPLNFTPNLFFGLTKEATLSEKLQDNTYDIAYTISVHNLGNDTLFNVSLKDSLYGTTIKQPATYTMKSGPTASGSFTANSSYNGNSDVNLLMAGSKIAPGVVQTIMFSINVNPDTVRIISNSASGIAFSSASVAVTDTSNAGNNPDSNGNGIWNEASDNMPTVIVLPESELFIPGGFSPNGDGKNDLFVIKGLDKTIENTLIIFNRWGNKVYQKDNYDNTWDGSPNTGGTLGNQKLPQGTYYYILEFKNSDLKPVNGFVILQY